MFEADSADFFCRILSLSSTSGSTSHKLDNEKRLRLMFTGQIGGDRAVVTTAPFPHLGTAVQHGLPFTWAFPSYNPADGATVEVGPHIVTYFEVTIEEQVDPDPEPSSRRRMAAQMPRQGYVYVD